MSTHLTIEELLSYLDALISSIQDSRTEFNKINPAKLDYLKTWFDSRISTLMKWQSVLKKHTTFYNPDVQHVLAEMQSIPQGFDVDLDWSSSANKVDLLSQILFFGSRIIWFTVEGNEPSSFTLSNYKEAVELYRHYVK